MANNRLTGLCVHSNPIFDRFTLLFVLLSLLLSLLLVVFSALSLWPGLRVTSLKGLPARQGRGRGIRTRHYD